MTEEQKRITMNWQPIETAPKDGTAILVHWFTPPWNGEEDVCKDTDTYVTAWWGPEQAGRWVCYMDMICEPDLPINPTHWMPLPDPPKP